jgi:hypothetical protein
MEGVVRKQPATYGCNKTNASEKGAAFSPGDGGSLSRQQCNSAPSQLSLPQPPTHSQVLELVALIDLLGLGNQVLLKELSQSLAKLEGER